MKSAIFVFVLLLYGSHGESLRGLLGSCKLPCSHVVCCLHQCSANDHFVCSKGIAKGGCNDDAAYWLGTTDCDRCCDISDCNYETCDGRVEPPEEKCGFCPLHACAKNQCSDEHPYVCIEGNAIGGCNMGPTYWTETDDNCSKCCDLKTCAGRLEPSPCEKECSDEVCHKHQCSPEHPFACTAGGTASDATNPIYGCNAGKDYWVENDLNCMDCCDVRKCPETGRVEPTTVTVPVTTKPVTTVPETTKPATTVPETTKPATTVPETTKPATTVPETTKPATTKPPCEDGQVAPRKSTSMSISSSSSSYYRRRRARQ